MCQKHSSPPLHTQRQACGGGKESSALTLAFWQLQPRITSAIIQALRDKAPQMAARVDNYKRFRQKLNRLKATRDLFVLFDDRPSHRAVREFCNASFNWLDNLADSNGLVLFVPLEVIEKSTETSDGYQNCSLQIAREFHLKPNQLPAFLFFTLKNGGEICVEHCAWLPFKAKAFEGDADDGQDLVSELFSAVSVARRKQQPSELVLKLREEIERVKRAEQMRPLKKWIKKFVISLEDLPADIVRSLVMAGVTGKKAAGGG